VEVRGGEPENAEHGINGLTTDPGLNAKPAASDESAKDGGNVGATDTEGSAHKDGEGDAVFGAGMGIGEHGNQDDEIAEEDGQNGLNPVHALGNEARGKRVGGNTDAHGHPARRSCRCPRRDRFVKAPCARRRNADGGRG
jgi:hypothetical protein